jgi:hypothetical protein
MVLRSDDSKRSNAAFGCVASLQKDRAPSYGAQEGSSGFPTTRTRGTAAGSARATDAAAVRAHGEINGAEMAAAMLAIWLTSARTRRAICLNGHRNPLQLIGTARRKILAHDGAKERARAHWRKFEQAHLFFGQAHLSDRIIDDRA